MFVRDQKRKLVVLPMILSKHDKGQNCSIEYDQNGKEIYRNCWENDRYDTTFAGLKAIKIDIAEGIQESYSYDFVELLKNDTQVYDTWGGSIYPRQFTQLDFRVGYMGDVLYTLNNLFGHFAIMGGDATFVSFDTDILDPVTPTDNSPENEENEDCTYTPPSGDGIVCQMYC
jgi:hypothetical protein